MTSYITLNHLVFFAHHGVSPQETQVGNTFIINIKLGVDLTNAMLTDDINKTVSYADVYAVVREEMAVSSKLLEHVAGRITRRLFCDFPLIHYIHICLFKQNPPMGADIRSAGVEIEIGRDEIQNS